MYGEKTMTLAALDDSEPWFIICDRHLTNQKSICPTSQGFCHHKYVNLCTRFTSL